MKEAWLDAVDWMPAWVAWILIGFHFLAPIFHTWQNRPPQRMGGPISRAKAAWLVHVAALWVVLPVLLVLESPTFCFLAISMGVWTLIELPLCAKGKWKTSYGLAHDILHLALVALLLRGGDARIWLWLTALTVVAEIFFVFRFKKLTAGPANGVFFVPDGPTYSGINLLTDFVRMPSQYLMISVLIAACLK